MAPHTHIYTVNINGQPLSFARKRRTAVRRLITELNRRRTNQPEMSHYVETTDNNTFRLYSRNHNYPLCYDRLEHVGEIICLTN